MPSSLDGKKTYLFRLHQKSQRKEQALMRLTEEETSQFAELVDGRKKTALEALTDGPGRKDGIGTLIGRWTKSEAILLSGEDLPGSRWQADRDFIALQHGISGVTSDSRWMLEKIAARNPHCKDFSFTSTIASIKVSGPALHADIFIIPSTTSSTFTFTVSYESVQNGKEDCIKPKPLSKTELWNLLERLALTVLNHVPKHKES